MPTDVTLREVRDADLPIFFEQQRDPAANYMAAFTGKDPEDRDAFFAQWVRIRADPTVTSRTILVDGQPAGSVATWVDASWLGKPEVTYWIGREYWGKGVATRALAVFLARVDTRRPLYARPAHDNIGSLRVLEKCGFMVFGREKAFANARGTEVDELLLELRADTAESTKRPSGAALTSLK